MVNKSHEKSVATPSKLVVKAKILNQKNLGKKSVAPAACGRADI